MADNLGSGRKKNEQDFTRCITRERQFLHLHPPFPYISFLVLFSTLRTVQLNSTLVTESIRSHTVNVLFHSFRLLLTFGIAALHFTHSIIPSLTPTD